MKQLISTIETRNQIEAKLPILETQLQSAKEALEAKQIEAQQQQQNAQEAAELVRQISAELDQQQRALEQAEQQLSAQEKQALQQYRKDLAAAEKRAEAFNNAAEKLINEAIEMHGILADLDKAQNLLKLRRPNQDRLRFPGDAAPSRHYRGIFRPLPWLDISEQGIALKSRADKE